MKLFFKKLFFFIIYMLMIIIPHELNNTGLVYFVNSIFVLFGIVFLMSSKMTIKIPDGITFNSYRTMCWFQSIVALTLAYYGHWIIALIYIIGVFNLYFNIKRKFERGVNV